MLHTDNIKSQGIAYVNRMKGLPMKPSIQISSMDWKEKREIKRDRITAYGFFLYSTVHNLFACVHYLSPRPLGLYRVQSAMIILIVVHWELHQKPPFKQNNICMAI